MRDPDNAGKCCLCFRTFSIRSRLLPQFPDQNHTLTSLEPVWEKKDNCPFFWRLCFLSFRGFFVPWVQLASLLTIHVTGIYCHCLWQNKMHECWFTWLSVSCVKTCHLSTADVATKLCALECGRPWKKASSVSSTKPVFNTCVIVALCRCQGTTKPSAQPGDSECPWWRQWRRTARRLQIFAQTKPRCPLPSEWQLWPSEKRQEQASTQQSKNASFHFRMALLMSKQTSKSKERRMSFGSLTPIPNKFKKQVHVKYIDLNSCIHIFGQICPG